MFEGKYFLNRFTLVTINVVCDVIAVKLRRSTLAVIYSAQIFIIFGEKFFLADVCLWISRKRNEMKMWVSNASRLRMVREKVLCEFLWFFSFYAQQNLQNWARFKSGIITNALLINNCRRQRVLLVVGYKYSLIFVKLWVFLKAERRLNLALMAKQIARFHLYQAEQISTP